MKKLTMLKTCIMTIMICIVLFSTCGCAYSGYRGNYTGAYTLVYTQVPDTRGARNLGPGFDDPQILLLETDSKGRGLYLYFEDTEGPLSIVIVQMETEDKVYFYPEKSAMSFKTPDSIYDLYEKKLSNEKLMSLYNELCSDEKLSAFKEQNDWDKPIDESKLDSASIICPTISTPWEARKGKVNLRDEVWKENMFSVAQKNGHEIPEDYLSGYHGINIYENWMAEDAYGRQLYYVEADYYVYSEEDVFPSTSTIYYLEMLAIINPDGSFDEEIFMVELTDKLNWNDQLREMKEVNGWNQSFEKEAAK